MNCQMQEITLTMRDGRTQMLENVMIRGSQVSLFDILFLFLGSFTI